MKTALIVSRWTLGIFICLVGFGGLFTPDYVIALVLLLMGTAILPPVYAIVKRAIQKNDQVILQQANGSKTVQSLSALPIDLLSPPETKVIPIKKGLKSRVMGWWQALRSANALERSIKRFRKPAAADILVVQQ
ncbi:MAG: hypothetical protein EOO04_36890, partial [Chitinophagaceae bacterium]